MVQMGKQAQQGRDLPKVTQQVQGSLEPRPDVLPLPCPLIGMPESEAIAGLLLDVRRQSDEGLRHWLILSS